MTLFLKRFLCLEEGMPSHREPTSIYFQSFSYWPSSLSAVAAVNAETNEALGDFKQGGSLAEIHLLWFRVCLRGPFQMFLPLKHLLLQVDDITLK